VHDPYADPAEAKHEYDEALIPSLDGLGGYDCIVGAVPHAPYLAFTDESFETLLKPGGLVADVKALWRGKTLPAGLRLWRL
jgi:UDP-N-acetyl-D-galactosamine dehydrogenase